MKQIGEKAAAWLYQWLEHMPHRPDWILYNSNVREDMMALTPTADVKREQQKYVMEKLSLCCMVMAAGVLLSLMLWIKGSLDTEIVDNRLYRQDYDGNSQSIELTVSDGEQSAQLEFELTPRSLTKQELDRLYDAFITELEQEILGRNESLDHISYDLNLVSSLEGYPFKAGWMVPQEYMDTKGSLLQETLEQPFTGELTVRVSYESFQAQYTFGCCIYGRQEPFRMEESLPRELVETDEKDREKEYVILPAQFHGKDLTWTKSRSHVGLLFLLMTPILTVMLYIMKDRDLHKQVELRAEELQADYPDIVSKISLLISAGMTVQAAWKRVVADYCRERDKTGKKRYAYEEMLLTIHEMENGYSVRDALERFGRRCKMAGYTRLSTLLAQNLAKGSANLAGMLQAEASNAFEERKHAARKLGEKAGTKLLLPMMLLLGIVMVIITVPALSSC